MQCPFEQEVGSSASPEHCPLWPVSCECLAEIVQHGFGGVDAQTCYVAAWWAKRSSFECSVEFPRRALPLFHRGWELHEH